MKLVIIILFLLILFFNIFYLNIKENFINSIRVKNDDKYLLNTPLYSYNINKINNEIKNIRNLKTVADLDSYNENINNHLTYDLSNNLIFDLSNNINIHNNICCKTPNCKYAINTNDAWRIKKQKNNDIDSWYYCCTACKKTNGRRHGNSCLHKKINKCLLN